MKHYDLAVIGAGSGGLVAALTANRRGMKVAMLEKDKIGGECTHSGCVPSKTLISSARHFHQMKDSQSFGLPVLSDSYRPDFSSVMEHVDLVVQGVYQNEQPAFFEDQGIDVYIKPSGAQFVNSNEIKIGNDLIHANYVVISTGSSPRMAPHEGGDLITYLDNQNFWEIRENPKSIIFLGGGVISVELGQSLARFGSEVTIIEQKSRILQVVDEEIGHMASELLEQEGIKLLTGTKVNNCLQSEGTKVVLQVEREGRHEEILAERIFVALGRIPNVGGLNLENAGVNFSTFGISTNDHLQTSAPNIYACGDVTSRAKFTHIASHQAEICIENIINGNHRLNDLSIVPWAIFMDPEISHVGLSETQAREAYPETQVFRVGAGSVDRFKTEKSTEGFLKIKLCAKNKILGDDAIGNHAGEWIQFFTLAIKNEIPLENLANLIFIYPTFSEIVKKAASRFLRTKES